MKKKKFDRGAWIAEKKKQWGKHWLPKNEYYHLKHEENEFDNEFHSIVSK